MAPVKAPIDLDIEENAFELFFRSSPRPMYVFDRQNLTFLEVNDSAAELYGYSRQELLQMSVVDIRPPEEVPRFLAFLRDEISGDETWVHRRRGGELLHVEVGWSRIHFSGREAQLVVVTDVTSLEETRAELAKSEERFRVIFDASPIGIALSRADFRFVDANPAFCRLLGYDLEEVRELTFLDVTYPADVGTDADLARQLFSGAIPSYSLEKRYLTKKKQVIWVNLTATVVHREDGTVQYAIGMIEDITARKDREAKGLVAARRAHRTLATLTQRETEVLERVAQGLTAREVATSFTISARTAESHLASIYRKLGVTSRDAAVRTFLDLLSTATLPLSEAEVDVHDVYPP